MAKPKVTQNSIIYFIRIYAYLKTCIKHIQGSIDKVGRKGGGVLK